MTSAVQTVSWASTPNYRGTYDLLISCITTLIICVWSALHLNVPLHHSKLGQRNLRRIKWICLGIFAPELVVSTAFAQYLTAYWLRREILKDIEYRKSESGAKEQDVDLPQEWSITQCYFAAMGGITIQAGSKCFENNTRLTLTPEGIRLLSFLGRLPQLPEDQVKDKSKADGLAKSIVILQASWMILQVIGRLASRLPITLLEINTVGHVLCALVLYLLWWSKPLEVKDPVILTLEEWMLPYLSLMYMCSPISAIDEDEITEMRCIAYVPKGRRRPVMEDMIAPTTTIEEVISEDGGEELRPHETHFSVGSWATRNPAKFIGPIGEFSIGPENRSASLPHFDHHVSYIISGKEIKVAREHQIFFDLQTTESPLQHSASYCRRALIDCQAHELLSDFAIQRWKSACTIIDDLWGECQKRPQYESFYFTISSLGTFVGEINYIATHIPNFLGLSYLGHVNVHRDYLKAALSFAAAAYGALHVAAWNEYFPSRIERLLWIISSTSIGSSGVFLWTYFLIKQNTRRFDRISVRLKDNRVLTILGRCLLGYFVLARMYLVVEAFVSLRQAPQDVYIVPGWSEYVPHF